MFKKDKTARDAFTLSLGGVTTINSFVAAAAIAHDKLNQVQIDGAQKRAPGLIPPLLGRFWLSRASA